MYVGKAKSGQWGRCLHRLGGGKENCASFFVLGANGGSFGWLVGGVGFLSTWGGGGDDNDDVMIGVCMAGF